MWFKSCRLYDFVENKIPFTNDQLAEALEENAFRGCGPHELKHYGWVSPLPGGQSMLYEAGPLTLISLQKESRLLPATVIKSETEARIKELEAKEGRRLRKPEKANLREEAIDSLMPRAFTQTTCVEALIDRKHGRLLINTGSAKPAEHLIMLLRHALGSLKVALPSFDSPSLTMTDWVNDQATPENWDLDQMCVIQDGLSSKGTIRCQHQDLADEHIQGLLEGAREVTALKVRYKDNVSFVLKEDGSLTGIKFLDTVMKRLEDIAVETPEERFDADFAMMSETLVDAVDALYEVL